MTPSYHTGFTRGIPAGICATEPIRTLHEGLLADGFKVSLVKLCAWFGVPQLSMQLVLGYLEL